MFSFRSQSRSLHLLPFGVAILLLSKDASSFSSPSSWRSTRLHDAATLQLQASTLQSSLAVSNDTDTTLANSDGATTMVSPLLAWNNTFATREMEDLAELMGTPVSAAEGTASSSASELLRPPRSSSSSLDVTEKRIRLKQELARVAITGFHPDTTKDAADDEASSSSVQQEQEQHDGEPRTAECIMKELEQMHPLPIQRPAQHHSLNAHWSFVFTGVPTIGMRLITLLSRMSKMFPFEILDFRDVALCVIDGQSEAKAVVEVKVCGCVEVLLEVCTSLRRPEEEDLVKGGEYEQFGGEEGTLLLEHFRGIDLNGVKIPTPKSWHTTRTLEITYMDKDIMIARTSGGEPHLLLRNSPLCYSPQEMMLHVDDDDMEEDVEECDLEGGNRWTEFFGEAMEMYGEKITRCLVDRDFGMEEYTQNKKEVEVKVKSKSARTTDDDADVAEEWWKTLSGGINLGQPWGLGGDK